MSSGFPDEGAYAGLLVFEAETAAQTTRKNVALFTLDDLETVVAEFRETERALAARIANLTARERPHDHP